VYINFVQNKSNICTNDGSNSIHGILNEYCFHVEMKQIIKLFKNLLNACVTHVCSYIITKFLSN